MDRPKPERLLRLMKPLTADIDQLSERLGQTAGRQHTAI